MDYPPLYSRAAQVGLLQGGAAAAPPVPGLITFAYGLPDPGSFPTEALQHASARVLAEHSETALQYGSAQGEPRLRRFLAERLNEREGLAFGPEQVAVTCGSLQAIGLIAQLLVDPGDTILLEAPTFLGAVRVFRLFGPRMEELPLDEDGLIVMELERRLKRLAEEGVRPKFLYTMPTFHNPAGVTMPLERRLRLLELAYEHDLLVIEDDAYGELRYEGSNLPSLLALDHDGRVVRLETFSKILAAGLRLGWAVGPEGIVKALQVVKADGGTSPFTSELAVEWARSGDLEPHVVRLRGIYRERRDAMLAALEQYCGPYCEWTRPEGGFYVWVELHEDIAPDRLSQAAGRLGVAYLPGTQCFASETGERFMRLCFSLSTPEQIQQGVERLGRAMAEATITDHGRWTIDHSRTTDD